MSALKRNVLRTAAFFAFVLGLYAGGVKADIYACLLAGSPMQYCQSFTDVAQMLAAVGSNPYYGTAADCAASCY